MSNIQISLAEVSDTAAKLRSTNQMMYDDLNCNAKRDDIIKWYLGF